MGSDLTLFTLLLMSTESGFSYCKHGFSKMVCRSRKKVNAPVMDGVEKKKAFLIDKRSAGNQLDCTQLRQAGCGL